jgi:hypothetical protein
MKKLKRDLFPSLERKVYHEDIRSVAVLKNEKVIWYVIYDKRNEPKWWHIEAQDLTRFECGNLLDRADLPKEEVKITSDFWTCSCAKHFIHHKVQMTCPICKLTVSDDTQILNVMRG